MAAVFSAGGADGGSLRALRCGADSTAPDDPSASGHRLRGAAVTAPPLRALREPPPAPPTNVVAASRWSGRAMPARPESNDLTAPSPPAPTPPPGPAPPAR